MTQQQFNVLDALICSLQGKTDFHELAVMAALAIGLAQSLTLTTSTTLQSLALDVWG